MILSMLVNHPKVEDLYDSLTDDSEHACKLSKGGSKSSVLNQVRLSVQAVRMETTGVIINNKKGSMETGV